MVIDFNIRCYEDKYFAEIDSLNSAEGWKNIVEHKKQFRQALNNSNAYVALDEANNVVGYIRTITDEFITLFICELLIKASHRSLGIGKFLINHAHHKYPETRIELLATKKSSPYYENRNFRRLYGYRKSARE